MTMATRVHHDDQTEYFKQVPRTLQEAFGPHCTDYVAEVEPARKVTLVIRPRHMAVLGVILVSLLSFVVVAQAFVRR